MFVELMMCVCVCMDIFYHVFVKCDIYDWLSDIKREHNAE